MANWESLRHRIKNGHIKIVEYLDCGGVLAQNHVPILSHENLELQSAEAGQGPTGHSSMVWKRMVRFERLVSSYLGGLSRFERLSGWFSFDLLPEKALNDIMWRLSIKII